MLNAVKIIVMIQSYVAVYYVTTWVASFGIFTPWWLKLIATAFLAILILAPVAWMFLEDEEHKKAIRRQKRMDYLERELSG